MIRERVLMYAPWNVICSKGRSSNSFGMINGSMVYSLYSLISESKLLISLAIAKLTTKGSKVLIKCGRVENMNMI